MDNGYAVYDRKEELKDYTTEEIVEELKKRKNASGIIFTFTTRLEKARELCPDITEEDMIQHKCPGECIKRLADMVCPEVITCKACWNMKYTEG